MRMRLISEVLPYDQTPNRSRHLRVDRDDAVLALPLCAVESQVRGGHQLVRVVALGERGHAEACRDVNLSLARWDGEPGNRQPKILRERLGPQRIGLGKQDRELLAPESRRQVDTSDPPLQDLREDTEHFVADLVPKKVVDVLEVVEVRDDEREAVAETLRAQELRVE